MGVGMHLNIAAIVIVYLMVRNKSIIFQTDFTDYKMICACVWVQYGNRVHQSDKLWVCFNKLVWNTGFNPELHIYLSRTMIRISLIKSEYGPIWMKNEESCHYEISDILIYHSNRETKGKGQQTLLHFTYYLVKSASVSFNDFHFPYGSSSPTQVLLYTYIFHVTI